MINIPIYMHSLLSDKIIEEIKTYPDTNPFIGDSKEYEYYGPSARWFFGVIFNHIGLDRTDEIAIITTSDDIYVSTCVTIPCFNYAKVSRVITNKTKVIVLIHEYGYVINDISSRIEKWRDKGIIVVEDCAHVAGLKVLNKTVGSFGDFALYSLTKVIPGEAGGLLRSNRKLNLPNFNLNEVVKTNRGIEAAANYLPKQMYFNNRRQERYDLFKMSYINELKFYEPSFIFCPYFVGLFVDNKENILEKIEGVEWGATLNKKKIYIPTNPLVDINLFSTLLSLIKNVIEV